jgi:hypothetical protein
MAEEKKLLITTIPSFFGKEGISLEELYINIEAKLLSYTNREYPLAICLSSSFEDGALLGTLNFLELDIDGYPVYTGDVVKSNSGFFNITYSTELSHKIDKDSNWLIRLGAENQSDIKIKSVPTTSLNPTSVSYEGIDRLTSGACKSNNII